MQADKQNDLAGAFKRTSSVFRDFISEEGPFLPEANRYYLYVAYACPWASRCLALYYIKGLEDVIGLSIVHPTWQRTKPDSETDTHADWVFRNPGDAPLSSQLGYGSFPCDHCIPDSVNGALTIRELYEKSVSEHPHTSGVYSVPVLWDKKLKVIVNNESSEITSMFNSQFNHLCRNPDLNLEPTELKEEMEKANAWIYPNINDGVYRCGFAKSQAAYNEAFGNLFTALDKLEEILQHQRYICGNVLTIPDIRAFVTLIRFDEVYVVYFKTNKKLIRHSYPNIFNYIKDIFQSYEVYKSVNMDEIKTHYYTSHPHLNTYAIIPNGNPDNWSSPHDRERFTPY